MSCPVFLQVVQVSKEVETWPFTATCGGAKENPASSTPIIKVFIQEKCVRLHLQEIFGCQTKAGIDKTQL